jgi:hypothetical protein
MGAPRVLALKIEKAMNAERDEGPQYVNFDNRALCDLWKERYLRGNKGLPFWDEKKEKYYWAKIYRCEHLEEYVSDGSVDLDDDGRVMVPFDFCCQARERGDAVVLEHLPSLCCPSCKKFGNIETSFSICRGPRLPKGSVWLYGKMGRVPRNGARCVTPARTKLQEYDENFVRVWGEVKSWKTFQRLSMAKAVEPIRMKKAEIEICEVLIDNAVRELAMVYFLYLEEEMIEPEGDRIFSSGAMGATVYRLKLRIAGNQEDRVWWTDLFAAEREIAEKLATILQELRMVEYLGPGYDPILCLLKCGRRDGNDWVCHLCAPRLKIMRD